MDNIKMTLLESPDTENFGNTISEHERMKKSKRGIIVFLATIILLLVPASVTFFVLFKGLTLRSFGIGGVFAVLQKAELGCYIITTAAFSGSIISVIGNSMDPKFASLRTCLKVGAIALAFTFLRGGIEANKGDWLLSGGAKIVNDTFHVPVRYYLDVHGIQQTYKVTEPNSDVEVIWVVVPNQGNDTKLSIESSTEPILISRYHGKKSVSLVKGFSVQEHMKWLLTGNNYNGSIGNFNSEEMKDTQQRGALESAFYLGDWEDKSLISYIGDNFSKDSAACKSEESKNLEQTDTLHQEYCSVLQKSGSMTPAVNGTFLKGTLYLNSKGLGESD